MEWPAIFVLGILAVAVVLFITEKLRMDLVALLVLGTLAVTGMVTPEQALAGFSNPAVVTVWAMFILSAALVQTGVADVIGRTAMRFAGKGETRMVVTVMLTSAVLSAFMNNIGVAALMLPVVLQMGRQAGHPPSRLLMPLAYGSLLGGLTTLIGTPPNILVSEAISAQGGEPFGMFDFVPVGGAVMAGGILFIAIFGRRMLPRRDPARESATPGGNLPDQYALSERRAVLRIPEGARLAGRTLRESRLGRATGLNVYGILREGRVHLAPDAEEVLRTGDCLLVEGRIERLEDLRSWRQITVRRINPDESQLDELFSRDVGVVQVRVADGADLHGQTFGSADFRRRFGVLVLARLRGGDVRQFDMSDATIQSGDLLLIEGLRDKLEALDEFPQFEERKAMEARTVLERYQLRGNIFRLKIPQESVLSGRSLVETRLASALGVGVMARQRGGELTLLPDPHDPLAAGDRLYGRGRGEDIEVFRGLQELEFESEVPAETLETLEVGDTAPMEVMLSPRSKLVGRSLADLAFRDRYGLQVLAVLRGGNAVRSGLGQFVLRMGDALLLLGPASKRKLLCGNPDFLVLTDPERAAPDRRKGAVAAAIMAAVILPVIFGVLPIAISAVAGAALAILFGCITFDDAYRAIEWRSVFLIAGMLPLGVALESTGAAAMVAEGVVGVTSSFGPWGVLLGLYLMTAIATSIIPTAALVVLMSPIVFRTAAETGVSTEAMMMAIAVAASASFTSPISHPANILVMGPGGYRFIDYVKLGVPLTLMVLVIVLLVLPLVWPLVPAP
ncbi:hypothetical protein ABI59_00525 [Acidobacteria bacterium Mor1]|nr:hypothetical protein ABI59_00525 [Acidobacteria bacterium Mor1]